MSGGVDAGVIEACRNGDREAFRVLFEAYKDKVYSIALYYCGGDEAAAKDISQQVFLKVMTSIGQFRGDAEFTTWLYRLTANACTDRRRSGRWLRFFGDTRAWQAVPDRRSEEASYLRGQVEQAVQSELAKLGPKLRLAILLRYFEELSYEEIGKALNCSAGTVASRLSRGHRILAKKLAHLRGAVR